MKHQSRVIVAIGAVGFVLAVIFAVVQSPRANNASQIAVSASATVSPQPTPNWDAVQERELDKIVQLTKIDLACMPPCLAGFEPMKTTMPEVFDWVKGIAGIDLLGSNGPANSPRNAFGSDYGYLKILAFSDDSQPIPNVMAMYYRVLLTRNWDVKEPSISTDQWLPANVVEKHRPLRVFVATSKVIDKFGGDYYMIFDFGIWAVGYGGFVTLINDSLDFRICPHNSYYVYIYVYSQQEENVISLLRSIAAYPNIQGYFNPAFPADEFQEISQADTFTAILDQLRKSQCIDPKMLSGSK